MRARRLVDTPFFSALPQKASRSIFGPSHSTVVPDGRYLLYLDQSGPSGAGIWALPTTGDKKLISILQSPSPQARIVQYRLSPNGRWLAYSSTESGREEIYVTHFPSGGGRWQVSQSGGTYPTWRGDSKEMYFYGLDVTLNAVSVNPTSEEFSMDPPHVLAQAGYLAPIGVPYAPAPDGKRFVIATYPEGLSSPLVLVTNWNTDSKK